MKPTTTLKGTTKKVVNLLLAVMVLAGIVIFSSLKPTNTDGELMSRMFLVFFGLIITVQIIPGLILFGAMLKELCGFGRKQQEEAVRK